MILPDDTSIKPQDTDATSKRKAGAKYPNQLILNLFHGGKRYYLLVCNSISEKCFDLSSKDKQVDEGVRMFFLLDANLKVICQHRTEQQ